MSLSLVPTSPWPAAGRDPLFDLEPAPLPEGWLPRLLAVLQRQRWLVLSLVALFVGLALAASYVVRPYYVADGTMILEHPSEHLAELTPEAYPPALDEERELQTDLDILGSRAVAAPVVAGLHLEQRDPEIAADLAGVDRGLARKGWRLAPATRDEIADGDFAAKLKLMPDKISRMVHIEYGSRDPGLAATVVNALTAAYRAQTEAAQRSLGGAAAAWMRQQLAAAGGDLARDDAALQRFQQTHAYVPLAVPGPSGTENVLLDRLAAANKDLSDAQAERIADQALAQSYDGRVVAALPADLRDPAIEKAAQNLSDAQADLDSLSAVYAPGFPAVAEAQTRLDNDRRTLGDMRAQVRDGLQQRLAAARQRETQLQTLVASLGQQAANASGDDLQFALLKQRDDAQRALYETLRQKLAEIGLTETLPPTYMHVLDAAQTPLLPAYPRLGLDLGLGLALGLLFGVGAALARERWQGTLTAGDELARSLGRAFAPLALVADYGAGARRALPPTAAGLGAGPLAAYDRLAAQILTRCGPPPRALLLTSANPGEGKTTTLCQLGLALARGGWRCLLVDADLRRPGCHRFFGLPQEPGLLAALQGRAVTPLAVAPRLDLMPCEENAGQALQPRALAPLLDGWRERYDYILFDSPPANFTGDALLLAALVEGVVVLVEWGATRLGEAQQLGRELQAARAPLLGTVVNRADPGAPGLRAWRRRRDYFHPRLVVE